MIQRRWSELNEFTTDHANEVATPKILRRGGGGDDDVKNVGKRKAR